MPAREWTGSVAVLPDSMAAFAVEMMDLASERDAIDEEDTLAFARHAAKMVNFLRDHAYTLSEWSAAVRELYARLDEGEKVTNAQGVAMARLLRNATSINVRTGGCWVPTGHIGFDVTYPDGRVITGSIEPDGSTNT